METDLVRTLKQLINHRNARAIKQQQMDQSSVTLFGQKLTAANVEAQEQDDPPPASCSEKLPPTAILHLKELYEQHIKRKARCVENGDALATLPLLNSIQDKENVGVKRQRIGLDRFTVSGSQQAPSSFPAPPAAAAEEEMEEEDPPRTAAPLTVFYNGLVYVYEDIPADKAQAIMILAGNSSTASSSRTVSSDTGSPPKEARAAAVKRAFTLADLPQARKASLQRFLEKRRERLVVKSDKMKRKSPARKSLPERKLYIEEAAQAGLVLSQ